MKINCLQKYLCRFLALVDGSSYSLCPPFTKGTDFLCPLFLLGCSLVMAPFLAFDLRMTGVDFFPKVSFFGLEISEFSMFSLFS